MGDIIIKVRVPDNKEDSFKLVEDIIKHYDRKSNIINKIVNMSKKSC